jgi:hypothetical protein
MAITTRSSIRVNPDLRNERTIKILPCEKRKENQSRSPNTNDSLQRTSDKPDVEFAGLLLVPYRLERLIDEVIKKR